MMVCCVKNLLEMDVYKTNSLGFCHMPVINFYVLMQGCH